MSNVEKAKFLIDKILKETNTHLELGSCRSCLELAIYAVSNEAKDNKKLEYCDINNDNYPTINKLTIETLHKYIKRAIYNKNNQLIGFDI